MAIQKTITVDGIDVPPASGVSNFFSDSFFSSSFSSPSSSSGFSGSSGSPFIFCGFSSKRISSAKPSSTAFFALIHVSSDIRAPLKTPSEKKQGEIIDWPIEYKDACLSYLEHYISLGYENYAIRRQEVALCRFVNFLHCRKIQINELNAEQLYEYFKTITHYSKSFLVAIRAVLVHSPDYFYENGFVSQQLSVFCLEMGIFYAYKTI